MSFDLGEFYDRCGSIEHRMGILRANEAVREWWQTWQAELGNTPRWGYLPFQSTPSEPDYWVQFFYHGMPTIDGADPESQATAEQAAFRQVSEAAQEVWDGGRAWANGLAGYLSDICAPFVRPQQGALSEVTHEFEHVRGTLSRAVPTNWRERGLDLADWVGGSSDAFGAFMDQLHDQVDEYAAHIAHACGWWASACALVLQTQSGVNAFLREVDDALHAQLVQWSVTQGNPQDISGEVNPTVLDVITLGDKITELIPGVSDVKGTVTGAVEAADAALALFGVEPDLSLPAPFEVRSAEQIWTGLTGTLHDDYRVKLDDALATMAEASTAAVADIAAMGESFYPVQVGDGARTPEWEHPLEG